MGSGETRWARAGNRSVSGQHATPTWRVFVTSVILCAVGGLMMRSSANNLLAHWTQLKTGGLHAHVLEEMVKWVGVTAISVVVLYLALQGFLSALRPAISSLISAAPPPSPPEPAPAATKSPILTGPMPLSLRMPGTPPQQSPASTSTPGFLSASRPTPGSSRRPDVVPFPLSSPIRAGSTPPRSPQEGEDALSPAQKSIRGTPKYCPSPPPRVEMRQTEDEVAELSTYEQYLDVLDAWGIPEAQMEGWEEALRQWFVTRLLRPLLDRASRAHTDVLTLAGKVGWKGTLRPLSLQGTDYSSWFLGAPAEGATLEDDLAACMQLKAAVEAEVAQRQAKPSSLFGFSAHKTEDDEVRRSAGALLRAVEDYMSLGRVLRGDFVPGILGATPPGYILTRTGQLAEGAAPLAAMVWDGGAPWGSRPWRPTHAPADSALLLYLLACYLEAPRWDFASRSDHRRPASYGPLFLGQMPHGSLPATRHFSALLEGSQAPKGGVAHAVVYDRALHPPQFQLVVGGKTTLVLRGRSGLFNTLVLWFWYARKHFRGLIGDLSISATLHLDDVFDHSQEPSILGLRRILGL